MAAREFTLPVAPGSNTPVERTDSTSLSRYTISPSSRNWPKSKPTWPPML
jgi:hypothetical protein